jgi:hypothetical protein
MTVAARKSDPMPANVMSAEARPIISQQLVNMELFCMNARLGCPDARLT